jgi:anthraniloyl-CoA monooxygenase
MTEAAMRVAVLGGGPAGLYFAILMQQHARDHGHAPHDITVHERNRADDTFGFGVVFSDQTLETFERYDPASYRAITEAFAYWDDIEIRFKGTVHRIGGNGFCGCARRTLLLLLHERCQALGVTLRFNSEFNGIEPFADADLIVAADGINSVVRERFRNHFRPSVDLRPNRFAWMGSTKPLDAFTFSFRQTAHGLFIAHAYQYEPGHSTWVMETDPATFASAGLERMSEADSALFLEDVFAADLDGHRLNINRSTWRRFPMIRNARCVLGNVVLLGDAKATAHFSIGSGTKLAMEDAIALFESFRAHAGVPAALAHFEAERRGEVERTQHAADVSLVWFEHISRFARMDPVQFAFGLMTRSKSITYDNLRLRAPGFVEATDRMFAHKVRASGLAVNVERPVPPMFQPFRLRGLMMSNRVVVSPMCLYSAEHGTPGDFHLVHYGSRAMGGAGLLFTEMVCVAADARITPGCAGLYTDAHEAAWTRIVGFARAHGGTKLCLQLGHAGRKGASRLMWDGMDRPLERGGWQVIAPSPLPYYPDSQIPRAMTRADMDRVRDEFVAAARRGLRCGFDMLELHCAHGYLLASFLSPLTNHRTDAYGGDLDHRLRFPLEVFAALRDVWPAEQPMSVRISATDWQEGGTTGADAVEFSRAFTRAGADLIDVSSGQTTPEAAPVYGRMFQTPFSDQVRNDAAVATMCVGSITTPDQVNTILAAGRADLVALARPHLVDPFFTLRAAAYYGVELPAPVQYLPGRDQLARTAAAAAAEMTELRRKARPKGHAGLKAAE